MNNFHQSQIAKRTPLGIGGGGCRLPLEKPFSIQININSYCNLHCEFCGIEEFYVTKKIRETCPTGQMSWELFIKTVDDIKRDFGQVRQILFTGHGDPLLSPQVAEMVRYITERNIAERVDIVTNGVALAPGLSDRLIDAGLSVLRVSVNGLSSEDYQKYCGRQIDFEKYVEQIRYFYTKKTETEVYVKIMNYMVSEPEKRELFYQIFEPICDVINIENIIDTGTGVDFEKFGVSLDASQYRDHAEKSEICTSPFYTMAIDEDGHIRPCCGADIYKDDPIRKNIKDESIGDIWKSSFIPFQRSLLDVEDMPEVCRRCPTKYAHIHPDDVLDPYVNTLKERYEQYLSTRNP